MKKLAKIVLLSLSALVLFSALTLYGWLRSTLPDYDGELSMGGLSAKVEVIRDSFGMPHIYAENLRDASMALGYSAAQDRLFQMDLVRRAIRGRLSEVLGPGLLKADKLFLTITARKSLEQLLQEWSPEMRSAMDAYAAGVNAFLEQGDPLPVEFSLLGYRPEPWQASDCAAAYYYMAWDLNSSFDTEMLRHEIFAKLGPDLANALFPGYPEGRATILPAGASTTEFLDKVTAARQALGSDEAGNSNNWVISGARSKTGAPILANDMHLSHGLPGIWYEAHIVTPEVNVSGVLAPGIPVVVVGANQHVAWGFTNVSTDDSDYYLEKLKPDDPSQYAVGDGWEEMELRRHRIPVKGAEAVDYTVRLTRHGPVIDEVNNFDEPPDQVLAMRWTAPELASIPQALYLFNRARSVDDMEAAMVHFKCPGQNIVYADRQGNIGYWAAAGLPMRQGFTGAELLPGWDGAHEWQGFVPTEEQPHLRNPGQGWIASANNKHVDDSYPHRISNNYAGPERYERIAELLTEQDKLGVEDFKRIHNDSYMILARDWLPPLLQALEGVELDARAGSAKAALEAWDNVASADAAAPLVFHAFVNALVGRVFRARLGEVLFKRYVGNRSAAFSSLRALLKNAHSPWWDDPGTEMKETASTVLAKSFEEGVAAVAAELGDDVSAWRWGTLHTLTFSHPFGRQSPLLARLFNRGPFARDGSFDTVNPMPYRLGKPWQVHHGASMRYIIDLGDLSRSQRVIPAGISGNFMSEHYDDQIEMWLEGRYRPFRLGREAVDADARHRLHLAPE